MLSTLPPTSRLFRPIGMPCCNPLRAEEGSEARPHHSGAGRLRQPVILRWINALDCLTRNVSPCSLSQ